MLVRALNDDDRSWKEEALRRAWGSTMVARKGELIDTAELPGLVVVVEGQPLGLLTYAERRQEIEIVTLQVESEGRGLGRALMDGMADRARRSDARRIWLVTTNDNTRAIDFYQRWGMDLAGYIRNGAALSRRVKPSLPTIGAGGIPVRHELEFELRLEGRAHIGMSLGSPDAAG